MVKRFISFLGKEINGLHEAAYLLGVFAVLSQVLALLRDRLLVHTFGAGTTLDLYYAAFRIPDFLFVIIASFFSASIVIPHLSAKIREGVAPGRHFLSVLFSAFLLMIISASSLAFVLVPYLIPYLFPGFAEEPLRSEIILMTRILLLSPIFLGLSNLFASVTQLYNRFFIYGISPLLYNVGIIVGVVFLAPRMGVAGLVWGVALGAVMHFAVQAPFVIRKGLLPRLIVSLRRFREINSLVWVAMPRTLALSAQELSRFFLVFLASLMNVGSISIFSLSYNLQSVPLSIIGVSYSLAAFPTLANLFAAGESKKFNDLVTTTSRYIIFFSLPLIALFVVLRAHIVRVILGSGEFSWQDTRLTAAALAMFVVSLAAQGLILIFTRARYASGDTRTSFYVNMMSVIVTIGAGFGLNHLIQTAPAFQTMIDTLFRVSDIPGTSVLMLPLAFSIGSILGATVHIFSFDRDHAPHGIARTLVAITGQMFIVSVCIGLVTYVTLNLTDTVFDQLLSLNTLVGIFTHGLTAGVVGCIAGIMLLVLVGSRELTEVTRSLRRRFWNTPVIGPDPNVNV